MATTKNYYTGDGTTKAFAFVFPYLNTNDIKVKLDGVVQATTEYTLTPTSNPTTVNFNTVPTNLSQIEIYRETSLTTANNVFAAGSAVKAASLNNNQTQALYALEEQENSIEKGEIFNYANANHSSGATAPTTPSTGDTWIDTASGRTYIYYTDTDTSQWVESNPPFNADGDRAFTQVGTGAIARTWDSKLNDYISVTDFGAVGDNTTESGVYIQNAINAAIKLGKALYIPSGVYNCDDAPNDTIYINHACGLATPVPNWTAVTPPGTLTSEEDLGGTAADHLHIIGDGGSAQTNANSEANGTTLNNCILKIGLPVYEDNLTTVGDATSDYSGATDDYMINGLVIKDLQVRGGIEMYNVQASSYFENITVVPRSPLTGGDEQYALKCHKVSTSHFVNFTVASGQQFDGSTMEKYWCGVLLDECKKVTFLGGRINNCFKGMVVGTMRKVYDNSKTYSQGEQIIGANGKLYKATATISAGGGDPTHTDTTPTSTATVNGWKKFSSGDAIQNYSIHVLNVYFEEPQREAIDVNACHASSFVFTLNGSTSGTTTATGSMDSSMLHTLTGAGIDGKNFHDSDYPAITLSGDHSIGAKYVNGISIRDCRLRLGSWTETSSNKAIELDYCYDCQTSNNYIKRWYDGTKVLANANGFKLHGDAFDQESDPGKPGSPGSRYNIATGAYEKTIDSDGAITINDLQDFYLVDTQSDSDSTDNLDTITGTKPGQTITLAAANSARTIVLRDGASPGNLKLSGNVSLDNAEDTITLIYNGTNWLEVAKADNGS